MKKFRLTKGMAIVCVLLAACLWGTTGIFIRRLNVMGMSTMSIVFLRALMTALCMLAVILLTDWSLLRIRLRDWWIFVGNGIVSLLFFNFCYFRTIEISSMGIAATLLYTSPAFVALLSAWLFKEKFTGRTAIALVLAFAGALLVSGVVTGGQLLTPGGLLLGVAGGFFYALYSIFTRYALIRGYHSVTITFYTFLLTALGGAAVADYGEIAASVGQNGASVLWLVALYALVTTVFPYTIYNTGLQRVENSYASVISSIELVCAAAFGLIAFGETPDIYGVFGIVLVLVAVAVLNLRQKKKAQAV
jgi:drug/metabolite transporter (DMT)-like permease